MLPLLFSIGLLSAGAQTPAEPPAETPAAPAPTCQQSVDEYITALAGSTRLEAYLCLAAMDTAGPALIAQLGQIPEDDTMNRPQVERALSVHLMQRLDRVLTGEEVRALSANERRLLRDAVHARRGRASPVEAHEKVFVQFDWYKPSTAYNPGRLSDLDRENLGLLDKPPKPPPPPVEETAADAVAELGGDKAGNMDTWCGCNGAGALGAGLWSMLALVPVAVRRRRPNTAD